jgi:hypothetical protein
MPRALTKLCFFRFLQLMAFLAGKIGAFTGCWLYLGSMSLQMKLENNPFGVMSLKVVQLGISGLVEMTAE